MLEKIKVTQLREMSVLCNDGNDREFYAPQTKILEGGTKDVMRIFERLFNGPWPKSSTHVLQKCFENPHYIFCSSFQNLRLGAINLFS
jgi:hypothetical protein